MSDVKMSVAEASAQFADIVDRVSATQQPVIVQKQGKSVVVLISAEEYAQIQRQREDDFAVIDKIRADLGDLSPDEVEAEITAIVEEVRAEAYEREKATKSRH